MATSTVSGELEFVLVVLKSWVQVHVAFLFFIHCRKQWHFIYLRLISPNGADCSSVGVKQIHKPSCGLVALLLKCPSDLSYWPPVFVFPSGSPPCLCCPFNREQLCQIYQQMHLQMSCLCLVGCWGWAASKGLPGLGLYTWITGWLKGCGASLGV